MEGTVRYMSVNAHFGIEQSRRDDLEAVGYLLVYFMKGGKLPWMGLKIEGIRERYKMIGHKKEEIRTSKLCAGLPRELSTYFRYVKSLKFIDEPDYNYLRNLFRSCLIARKMKEDDIFDWMELESLQNSPVPQSPWNPYSRANIILEEKYTPPKPHIVVFDSPAKSNLNRHISRSVGNIESTVQEICSSNGSEIPSENEEDVKINKANMI